MTNPPRIKTGAAAIFERLAKLNQIQRIEEELEVRAVYAAPQPPDRTRESAIWDDDGTVLFDISLKTLGRLTRS